MPMTTAGAGSPPRPSDSLLPSAILLIVFATVACVIPAQADSFYHLRSGQHMWESGSLITTEPFSWTHFGRPLADHWWLSQLAFYALYSLGGPVLLTLVAGAIALASLVLSWRLTVGNARVRLLVLSAFVLTVPEWSLRPQVFSLLFTALALHLLVSGRLALLLALLVLWANMHAVVVLGIAIAGVPLLDAILVERSRIRRGLGVACAAAAAPLMTPFGFHYWSSMFATVQGSRAIGLQEYRSAFNAEGTIVLFWLLAAGLVVMVVRQGRGFLSLDRATRLLTLAALVLLPAAVTSTRNIPFFVLAALPALSRLAGIANPATDRPIPLTRAHRWVVAAAVVLAAVFVVLKWDDGGRRLGWQPLTPAAITAIDSCPEPIYNGFDDGGALMWFTRAHRVFVDGRVEAYPLDFLLRAKRADEGDYQRLFADFGIRCAVVRTRPLFDALRRDPSMRLAFFQDGWAVFQR
jgi:hypothetical protein